MPLISLTWTTTLDIETLQLYHFDIRQTSVGVASGHLLSALPRKRQFARLGGTKCDLCAGHGARPVTGLPNLPSALT